MPLFYCVVNVSEDDSEDDSVDTLREAIKGKRAQVFGGIEANRLDLWRESVLVDYGVNNPPVTLDDIKENEKLKLKGPMPVSLLFPGGIPRIQFTLSSNPSQ
ncbi:hypothetical protein BGZ65_009458, partial [Modicella reniformis]